MDPTHILSDDYEPNNSNNFKPSWAKRKGYGKLYGKNYMDDYKAELELMFEQGKVNSSQKMNAAKMREQLCNKYPYKFSIPSETEIKKIIGSEFQKQKNTGTIDDDTDNQNTRGRRSGPKSMWATILEPMVVASPQTKPAQLLVEFFSSLGDSNYWPEDLPRDEHGEVDKTK